MPKARVVKRAPILALPDHDFPDIVALKAVNAGTASPEQQARAMQWIVKKLCKIGGLSYDPDNDAATSFSEGRRFVGITILHFLEEPMKELHKRFPHKLSQERLDD